MPAQTRKVPRDVWSSEMPAVLFDLDGTLLDSNYHHVSAWSEALLEEGIVIPRWKIHRRVGMRGKSMLKELLREIPQRSGVDLDRLERNHDKKFRKVVAHVEPLPGANQLLRHLSQQAIRVAIATTGGDIRLR
jgi:beta-phosphoglucomutase-like phosphatase (HAD superfamily)